MPLLVILSLLLSMISIWLSCRALHAYALNVDLWKTHLEDCGLDLKEKE